MHPPTNGRIHREKCAPYLGKCGVKRQDRGALKKLNHVALNGKQQLSLRQWTTKTGIFVDHIMQFK